MDETPDMNERLRPWIDHLIHGGGSLAPGGGDRRAAAAQRVATLGVDRLTRLAISITRHRQDAEDAVQNVLSTVVSRPAGLAGSDRPWTYLLRCVRNESIRVARRSRRVTLLRSLADLIIRTPVDQLELAEAHAEVWRSLRRLPAEQSEVVVLKIWESLTFAEIAAVTETTPETAASRYRYAMEKLRRMLSRYVQSPDPPPPESLPPGSLPPGSLLSDSDSRTGSRSRPAAAVPRRAVR